MAMACIAQAENFIAADIPDTTLELNETCWRDKFVGNGHPLVVKLKLKHRTCVRIKLDDCGFKKSERPSLACDAILDIRGGAPNKK